MRPWSSYFIDAMRAAVIGTLPRSSSDIVMSADRLTATRAYNTQGSWILALATSSGHYNSYVELTTAFSNNGDAVGLANRYVNTNSWLGGDANGFGWQPNGQMFMNVSSLPTGPTYASGDVIAMAISGTTVKVRNVTQNSAWFGPINISSLGPPPYYLALGISPLGDSATANFYGPFVGPVPSGFLNWNPEALSSEQPVKVLDFEADILDGSYTSTDINDLVALPFEDIRWGDANLDANNNLRFTDWIIQDDDDSDWPVFSICVTSSTQPANNYIWGAWDGGPTFLIFRAHLTTTSMVAFSNIPIPPPQVTNPNLGEGHTLALFVSCDSGAVFNWSNGAVYGTENVLVWAPIEYATFPPSALGIVQPVMPANVIQGGRWGPPVGPALGS